jgi:hypothetical protein
LKPYSGFSLSGLQPDELHCIFKARRIAPCFDVSAFQAVLYILCNELSRHFVSVFSGFKSDASIFHLFNL